jgi:hypothetical protein
MSGLFLRYANAVKETVVNTWRAGSLAPLSYKDRIAVEI